MGFMDDLNDMFNKSAAAAGDMLNKGASAAGRMAELDITAACVLDCCIRSRDDRFTEEGRFASSVSFRP